MLTAYCKKCKDDVTPGEVCPLCGGRLTKASLRVHWRLMHDPVKDWMCWNAAARLVLPVTAGAVLALLLLEALSGGLTAVQQLLQGGLMHIVGGMLVVFFLLMWLLLLLQGEDDMECTLDSRGAHVAQYAEEPSSLQLLARFHAPAEGRVLLSQKDLAWKDIVRVDLWPEKRLILFYAPRWWMRLSVQTTPEAWPDAMLFLQEKIGKKKNVAMPEIIRCASDYYAPAEAEETLPPPVPAEEPLPFPADPPPEEPAPAEALPPPQEEDAPLPEEQVAGGEQESFLDSL